MGVLVKNTEMPKKCADCRFIMVLNDGYACCNTNFAISTHERHYTCPLVEVEEHTAFSNFDDKERKVYVSVD